jgi:hypothetical protein
MQLGIKPQTILYQMSPERCAEICYLEDSFKCRSFDISSEFVCYLFTENIKDKDRIDLKIKKNELFNHYSSILTNSFINSKHDLNKIILKGFDDEFKTSTNDNTISDSKIFASVLSVTIGGFIMGVLTAFVYLKLTAKKEILPVMKFVNPNYIGNIETTNE